MLTLLRGVGRLQMGANSTQGTAVLLCLLAFTFLGAALFTGGNLLMILLALITGGVSAGLFVKVKPWEFQDR
jgi:hypothetical protein